MSKKSFERMRKQAHERFDELFNDQGDDTKTLEYGTEQSKYVIFSDWHMGKGDRSDNFRQNKEVVAEALKKYRSENFSVILIGDVEEFHQAELFDIVEEYENSVYKELLEFPENRVYRIFGNHNIDWSYKDPLDRNQENFALEGIKLARIIDGEEKVDIMLTHGHQAEESYEKDLHTVRFGTTLYRTLEKILNIKSKSLFDESPGKKDRIYNMWAKEKQTILICGHTHCPIFSSHYIDYNWMREKYIKIRDKIQQLRDSDDDQRINELEERKEWLAKELEPIERKMRDHPSFSPRDSSKSNLSKYYFNSGSGIFKDAITNIEIEGDIIRLVYWFNGDNKCEVLWQKNISSILE